jgi:hypothetical protein
MSLLKRLRLPQVQIVIVLGCDGDAAETVSELRARGSKSALVLGHPSEQLNAVNPGVRPSCVGRGNRRLFAIALNTLSSFAAALVR